jgi:hypothetical protein
MRNAVLAAIVTLWGLGIVLSRLLADGGAEPGAYGAGQNAAFLLGLGMIGVGVRSLVRHFGRRG